jgi:tRNA-specific 2-thiouridylase
LRGLDPAKDQSYVLARLNQQQLSRLRLPLGASLKPDVRAEAAKLGFTSVADKPDSVDICFIGDGNTAGFLDKALGAHQGDIVDLDGNVLGSHDGYHHYTIGQRKHLNIRRPANDGAPRYVLGIDPVNNQVKVGPKTGLLTGSLSGFRLKWTGDPRTEPWHGLVQLRAHGAPIPCEFSYPDEDRIRIDFDAPTPTIAPGQTAVCYQDDEVIGAATIKG